MFFHCKAIVSRKLFAVRTNAQIDSKYLVKPTFSGLCTRLARLIAVKNGGSQLTRKHLLFVPDLTNCPPLSSTQGTYNAYPPS